MDAILFTEKGLKFITIKNKQKNSVFKKLYKRAKYCGFVLEKTGDKYIPYELFSNEKEPGVTRCCMTLKEVEEEVLDIESTY
jgi:hypothetical protein